MCVGVRVNVGSGLFLGLPSPSKLGQFRWRGDAKAIQETESYDLWDLIYMYI